VLDTQNITQTVIKMFVGGNIVGVHSNSNFTPTVASRIAELVTVANPTGTIVKGFNYSRYRLQIQRTQATIAESLVDGNGVVRTADSIFGFRQ